MAVGWIKVHREIFDHWTWKDKPFSQGQAWIDLIMKANHEEGSALIKGTVYNLSRGQQARSVLTLASDWGWSRGKVERFLKVLKTEHQIEHQTDNKTSIITICNYCKYQDRRAAPDTADDTTPEAAPEQHPSTNKKERTKEDNKRDKEKGGQAADLDFSLWPESPSKDVLSQWLKLRQKQKAPVSQIVIARFAKEIHEAVRRGFSVDDCLSEVIASGWKRFEADWLKGDKQSRHPFTPEQMQVLVEKARASDIGVHVISHNGKTITVKSDGRVSGWA